MGEMSAALDLRFALFQRLATAPAITALVPSGNIFDRAGRPERFPCIVLGEAQEVAEDDTFERRHVRLYASLHVLSREPGTTHTKAIVGAIRNAVHGFLPALDYGRCVDLRYDGARFLRDPDGETSHAVVTIEALVETGP
jgi:hypothetical protein